MTKRETDDRHPTYSSQTANKPGDGRPAVVNADGRSPTDAEKAGASIAARHADAPRQSQIAEQPPEGVDPNDVPAGTLDADRLPFNPDSPDPGSAPLQPYSKDADKAAAATLDHPGRPGSTAPRPGSPGDKGDRPKTPDEAGPDRTLSAEDRVAINMLTHGQTSLLGMATLTGIDQGALRKTLLSLEQDGLAAQTGDGWAATSRGVWLAGQVPEDKDTRTADAEARRREANAQRASTGGAAGNITLADDDAKTKAQAAGRPSGRPPR